MMGEPHSSIAVFALGVVSAALVWSRGVSMGAKLAA
jgi:hypothetical protein